MVQVILNVSITHSREIEDRARLQFLLVRWFKVQLVEAGKIVNYRV